MLDKLKEELLKLKKDFDNKLSSVNTKESLQEIKVKFLGKKGSLQSFFKKLGSFNKEVRPKAGKIINEIKEYILQKLEESEKKVREIEIAKKIETEKIDITIPGKKIRKGSLHPLQQTTYEIVKIFKEMGFLVAEGPEIETEFYNFDALNFPPDHPAKDMQDTFYIDPPYLLRTHTSPVQIRIMEKYQPPIAIIAPGNVYRCDADITHSPMFLQVEGLLVDKNVTFSDLKGTLRYFLEEFFNREVKMRFRPSFFPFTEPSVEVDIGCIFCEGKGCNICKNSGWLEVLGSGMVDPNVFEAVGIDPKVYQGYAFGLGVDRFAMLKYGINNIRLFYENRLDFLSQFK